VRESYMIQMDADSNDDLRTRNQRRPGRASGVRAVHGRRLQQ